MEPRDFYFQLCAISDPGPYGTSHFFTITPIEYFDSEGYISDESGVADEVVPQGFSEVMESTYEYEGDPLEGRDRLIELGFVEKNFDLGDCDPFLEDQDTDEPPYTPGTEHGGKNKDKKFSLSFSSRFADEDDMSGPWVNDEWGKESESLSKKSSSELTHMLVAAIEKEDFETATDIRDELNSREKK